MIATNEIHQIITERKLGKGSELNLKQNKNGKPGSSKFELSLVSAATSSSQPADSSDGLKKLLLTCILDAADIVKEAGIQFSNDELQKLATTLFIQRTR